MFGVSRLCGKELVQGIDGHELNPSRAVDLLLRYFSKYFLHHAMGASIPIVIRIMKQLTPFPEQRVIHAPCVDADGRQFHVLYASQRLAHFQPESGDVPVQRASVFDRLVAKAMDFFRRQNSRLQVRENSPSAFGPEIESQIRLGVSGGLCIRRDVV